MWCSINGPHNFSISFFLHLWFFFIIFSSFVLFLHHFFFICGFSSSFFLHLCFFFIIFSSSFFLHLCFFFIIFSSFVFFSSFVVVTGAPRNCLATFGNIFKNSCSRCCTSFIRILNSPISSLFYIFFLPQTGVCLLRHKSTSMVYIN